jgi:integrase
MFAIPYGNHMEERRKGVTLMDRSKAKHRGHGEGSIYYRKSDDRWVASFLLEDGKRKYLYGKTRREAYEKLQKALQEQQQGILAVGPQQTMKHYLEHWLENVHKPTIRLSSYTRYRKILNTHILPALGHIQVQKLSAQHLQELYASKLKEGLSPKTIKLIHVVLHKALENAVDVNIIARNVADIAAKSLPREPRHEIQPLTIEQAQKLLEVARGHRLEALIILAVTTGMRRGELIGLCWSDIDFHEKSLYVRRTVDRISGNGYVKSEPKTASGRRKIFLPPFVIEALKQHRTRQEVARLKAGSEWKDPDLVFCNTHGGFSHPVHLYEMFQHLLEDAGLPRMRFHDLRHSAATILMAMGIHAKVVQELLGHSNITMTLNIYSHVLPSLQKEAMEKWDDLFGQQDDQRDH